MHQRPIVSLIHKIQRATFGTRMPRNELRIRYHFHDCLIRLKPNLFEKLFDVLYSRILGFNRYTIILGKNRFSLTKEKCTKSYSSIFI